MRHPGARSLVPTHPRVTALPGATDPRGWQRGGGGQGPPEVVWSSPPLRRGHLSRLPSTVPRGLLNRCRDGGSAASGQPVPARGRPRSGKVSPPRSLLCSGLNGPSSLSPSSEEKFQPRQQLCGPLRDALQRARVCRVLGSPARDTARRAWAQQRGGEGKGPLPPPQRSSCCPGRRSPPLPADVQLGARQDPGGLEHRAAFQRGPPAHPGAGGRSPRGRTGRFPLRNSLRFPLAHVSSLPGPLWAAARPPVAQPPLPARGPLQWGPQWGPRVANDANDDVRGREPALSPGLRRSPLASRCASGRWSAPAGLRSWASAHRPGCRSPGPTAASPGGSPGGQRPRRS